eukprot:1252644-Pyramimonas_sp.AAC.1
MLPLRLSVLWHGMRASKGSIWVVATRIQRKLSKLSGLAASHGIVCVQGTHGSPEDFGNHFSSVVWLRAAGRGSVIYYSDRVVKLFPRVPTHVITPGRCRYMDFNGPLGRLRVINLHLDPDLHAPAKKRISSSIARRLLGPAYCACFIAGDFTYRGNGEVRSNLSGQLTFRALCTSSSRASYSGLDITPNSDTSISELSVFGSREGA